MCKRQILYFNIFPVCLFICVYSAPNYVLAGEMVECNPGNKVGECPIDKLYHRCQITKDENGRQKITYGRCETKEEDQNGAELKKSFVSV